ncbi:MAG TPA: DUF5916 domain-containing protein [Thermoanaerobaculia bacterium]|nr:DUF5916 domain-containing protein [Thermoanaerobaculia bacterium]
MTKASGPIRIDGKLDDSGWKNAVRVTTFYEIKPGENVTPKVETEAFITYDDHFFYVAFRCSDPDPKQIRAPFVERDHVFSDQDFVGMMLDTRGTGRSALELFVNPRNIVDDGINDDTTGDEDFSPDLFWNSAVRLTARGWNAEIAIPFSSLRYKRGAEQNWGIILFRNYPRDFRYEIASSKVPRGTTCFLCHERKLTGLRAVPDGRHLVVAPYATGNVKSRPRGDLGTPLATKGFAADGGVDLKFNPNENVTFDAAINPDFSQIESDTAQLSVNQRFALFYPEKRPFFLERSDLFTTPIQAVYTRSITSPNWGGRATGRLDGTAFTFLVTQDRGGGSVIIPGPLGSQFAPQDFNSTVAVGRARHGFGRSYVSFLLTDREIQGGGHNRVYGPDFQWRPNDSDVVTGQLLFSDTLTPDRPDLANEWDGRHLASRALHLSWNHARRNYDFSFLHQDVGADFRADDGFVPQVGFRRDRVVVTYSFYPTHSWFNRVRPLLAAAYIGEPGNGLLERRVFPGILLNGKHNFGSEIDWIPETVRVGTRLLHRNYLSFDFEMQPSHILPSLSLAGSLGQAFDYANARVGRGGEVDVAMTVRPTIHLDLEPTVDRQWLDLPLADGRHGRLFTAQVERLKATYTVSSRTWVRLIVQYVDTRRNPSLYLNSGVSPRDGSLTGSALFGYRINWETVLYLGYGGSDERAPGGLLAHSGREVFFKVSYAIQH